MKSVFDKISRDELINRINSLNEYSTSQWGKMNVAQMMKHCAIWDEMALGKQKYKQSFVGKLFGKLVLKSILNDERLKKNLPSHPFSKVNDDLNFTEERAKWIMLLEEYEHFSNDGFIHPFFGAMSKEQTGYIWYKHIDHHLRQFSA